MVAGQLATGHLESERRGAGSTEFFVLFLNMFCCLPLSSWPFLVLLRFRCLLLVLQFLSFCYFVQKVFLVCLACLFTMYV